MLDGRPQFVLEVAVVTLLVCGVFYLVAQLVRVFLKKRIDEWKHYYTCAAIAGFAVHRLIIILASADLHTEVPGMHPNESAPISKPQFSLDSSFVPPVEAESRTFPSQLRSATDSLAFEEARELEDALSFLIFAYVLNLQEQGGSQSDLENEKEIKVQNMVRFYRFAQRQGSSMTLRKYIDLSAEVARQKPHWWAAYEDARAGHIAVDPPN